MRPMLTILLMGTAVLAAPASAKRPPEAGPPEAVQRLLDCRGQTDTTSRLACFDRESAIVSSGLSSKDLVVVDRERARIAGRSVFGFSIPNFGGLLGSAGDVSSIDATVTSAVRNSYGAYTLQLNDNSVWSQTDDGTFALTPRPGNKVSIKRGALGSFILTVGKQPGMKFKRIQ